MARLNLDKMSLKDLQVLQGEVAAAIESKKVEEREALRAEIASMAATRGFSIQDLVGGKRAGGKLGKVAPKYRNPENPSETWTGRGRQPRWLAAMVKKGAKVEKFLIR